MTRSRRPGILPGADPALRVLNNRPRDPSVEDPRPEILPPPTPRRLAMAAFPLVLWMVATLALGGALGKSTDDYSTNLRDPASGLLPAGFRPFGEYNYFWRPAHLVLIHGLQTFLYEHDRFIHLLSAAAHGLVAALLYGFLVKTTRRPLVSASAAMLFVAFPVIHEGPFFTSFISGPIASALWFWLAIATVRWAALPEGDPRVRRWLAPLGVIALAIPFFYEQPGAAILAWPLLVLAAVPRDLPRNRRLARAAGLTALLASTQVAMATALLLTAPGSKRGSVGSLAGVSDWPQRALDTLGAAGRHLAGEPARQVVRGGLDLGWSTMTATSLWVWLVPLGLTGAAWWLASLRIDPPGPKPDRELRTPPARLVLLAAFGLAAAAASLAPVALVTQQSVVPRLLYFPSLAIALAGAAAVSAIAARLPAAAVRGLAPIAAFVVIGACSLGAIALVGIQQQYQNRSRADRDIAARLAALLPDPPPQTVFVPLRTDHLPTRTGRTSFDRLRPGAFETIWSATAITRQTYRRRDLWAAGWNPWRPSLIEDPTENDVRLNDRFVIWSPFANDNTEGAPGTRLPWANVVPFVVESGGRVRLVRRLVFEREDGSVVAIAPPIVASRLAGPLPWADTAVFRTMLPTPPDAPHPQPLSSWTWAASGQPATPQPCRAWPGLGNTRDAVWMHPTSGSSARAALETRIAAADRPRRLVIRAAVAEYDLKRNAASDPVVLTLSIDGRPATAVTVRRARFRAEQTWLPLVAVLPPSSAPLTLRLEIAPFAADLAAPPGAPAPSNTAANVLDPLWVTPGLLFPASEGGAAPSGNKPATQLLPGDEPDA